MEEIKCKNCGAVLHPDSYSKKVICNYCGTEYKSNTSYDININMDNNTKEIFNNVTKTPKIISIFIIMIIFMSITSFITFTFSFFTIRETEHNIIDNIDFEKDYFNSEYELYSGEQSYFFVGVVLDRIEENNKYSDHIITVYYKNLEGSNTSDIQNIKDTLENKNYILNFNYGEDLYINELIIEEE